MCEKECESHQKECRSHLLRSQQPHKILNRKGLHPSISVIQVELFTMINLIPEKDYQMAWFT